MRRILFSVLFTALLTSVGYAAPGDKIFYEDFSAYGEGELPAGWIDLSGDFKATILMKHYFHNPLNSYKNSRYDSERAKYAKERNDGYVAIHFGTYQIVPETPQV